MQKLLKELFQLPANSKSLEESPIYNAIIKNDVATLENLHIDILDSVESTNTYLLNKIKLGIKSPYVAVAKNQTNGRGRNGKHWLSNGDKSVCASIYQRFNQNIQSLSGLSLVVGMAVACAFRKFIFMDFYNNIKTYQEDKVSDTTIEEVLAVVVKSLQDIKVKWPNDIYYKDKKLSGVLIETMCNKDNIIDAVIGIGCNVEYDQEIHKLKDFSTTYLQQVFSDILLALDEKEFSMLVFGLSSKQDPVGIQLDKNKLLNFILHDLFTFTNIFINDGLKAFSKLWEHFDFLRGKTIALKTSDVLHTGVMCGINEVGALMLISNNDKINILNAEILNFSMTNTIVEV